MTVTITTTICAGNRGNTGTGGGAPSAALPASGGQGPSAEYPTESGGIGSTFPISSGSGPFAFNMSTRESLPHITASGGVTQPYQPPFANGTGSSGPSFPVGTGSVLPTGTPGDLFPSAVQPESTRLPGSEEQTQPPASEDLGSKAAATGTAAISISSATPMSSGPAASLEQDVGQASGKVEQPQASIQYPGALTTSPTILAHEGQGSANTQAAHNISTTPLSSIGGSIQDNHESISTGLPVTPPYGLGNNTSVGLGPATSSNFNAYNSALAPSAQTSTANLISSGLPPFVNTTSLISSTLPGGTGIPYQPPNIAPAHTSSTAPPLWTFSPASFQTPRYPVVLDNSTSISNPAGSAPLTTQGPLNSAPVYETVTKEVIPIPLTTTAKNSTTQQPYDKFYGNGSSDAIPTVTPDNGSGSLRETNMAHTNTSLPVYPQTTLPDSSVPIPTSSPIPFAPTTTGTPIPSPPSSSIPNTSTPPTSPLPPPITGTTAPSSPALPTTSIPNQSPPPPNLSSNQNTTTPTCNPTPTDTLLTAD
ncbi:MAG: hypothetical protein Q9188_006214, partial [Gyalolechia gomerana]